MKTIYSETREKMKFIDIKFMIFRDELDLLWIMENQRSEKSWNEYFGVNFQID